MEIRMLITIQTAGQTEVRTAHALNHISSVLMAYSTVEHANKGALALPASMVLGVLREYTKAIHSSLVNGTERDIATSWNQITTLLGERGLTVTRDHNAEVIYIYDHRSEAYPHGRSLDEAIASELGKESHIEGDVLIEKTRNYWSLPGEASMIEGVL